nr:MAG TPA: hypothetical protein [Caudoviricetes sp.]
MKIKKCARIGRHLLKGCVRLNLILTVRELKYNSNTLYYILIFLQLIFLRQKNPYQR